MSNKPYQPYDFFRRCSPVLLKAYFEQKGVVLNVDFEKLSPRKMSALNEAWQNSPQMYAMIWILILRVFIR